MPRPSPPIETAIDSFEQMWRDETPPDLAEALRQVTPDRVCELFEELVKLDLEYRWKNNCPRTLEHYLTLPVEMLAEIDSVDAVPLAAEEYRVRQRFGDRPDHAEYLSRFPEATARLKNLLAQVDGELDSDRHLLEIRIYQNKRLAFQKVVEQRIEIGRQLKDEPDPFAVWKAESGWRLIIASQTQNVVSRKHARFELNSKDNARVVNLSSTGTISLPGGRKLAGQESELVVLPVLLLIQDVPIRFSRI